jgi:cytochrome c oxidase subunit II
MSSPHGLSKPVVIRWKAQLSLIRRQPRPGRRSGPAQATAPVKTGPVKAARLKWSRKRRVASAAGLTMLVLALSGCGQSAWMRLGLPDPATKQAKVVVTLWQGSWIAAIAVGAVVWGMILWACIFHRKRSEVLPPQVRYNLPIEIVYTVVPFILVAVLFYFTARDENYVDAVSSHPNVVVNVTGFQWSWEFAYPQYKVPSPAGDVVLTGQPYPGPLPVLVIPENETVKFTLNSLDVVHSFWVPVFLFKRDVIPDHTNYFQVTATRTGWFIGRCTELCGIYHSLMLFKVHIVTPSQFKTFMAQQQLKQKAGGVQ